MTGPELDQGVENLAPYWTFVQCARVALGMQGSGELFPIRQNPRTISSLKTFGRMG